MKYCFIFLLILGLLGCQKKSSLLSDWKDSKDKVRILCTTPIVQDIVVKVGGERIVAISLIGPSIDPHSYELVKGDDEKFYMAQGVIYSGLGLEHGASLRTHLSKHPHALSLGDYIREKNPSLILSHNEQLDPHIWLDVSLWSQVVDPIVKHLSQLDPEGEVYYTAQGEKAKKELLELDQWMKQTLGRIPSEKRYLVTSHDAFHYFARRYLHQEEEGHWIQRFCAPEGLAPDGQLSFHDLERVLNHLQKHQIKVVFPETNVSQDSLRKIVEICRSKGLNVEIASDCLYSDTLGSEVDSISCYEKMMKHNVLFLYNTWVRNEYHRS